MRLHLCLTASLLCLVACQPKLAPPPPPTEALSVQVLDCGTIAVSDLDEFSSSGDYKGEADRFVVPCFLVEHPEGRLLWDLGVPGLMKLIGPFKQGIFTVDLASTVKEQLAARGLTPDDIDYISISHSHFDHIGMVDQVTGSTWLVHEAELAAIESPPAEMDDQQKGFLAAFRKVETREVFNGEKDVFGDGSVVIFETPGHTPGHTSLQLKLPQSGTVFLTGDLYHRAKSRELARVPRFNFNEEQTRASMTAFEARATAMNAKVIIQHEPADIEPLGGVIR